MTYNKKQRKNLAKILKRTRKDVKLLQKKLDKMKLWLDVYETLIENPYVEEDQELFEKEIELPEELEFSDDEEDEEETDSKKED